MKFTTEIKAGEHTIFAEGAWDHNIGKTIPITMGYGRELLSMATIVGTKIVGEGTAIEITLEVDAEISVEFNPKRREIAEFSFVNIPRMPRLK